MNGYYNSLLDLLNYQLFPLGQSKVTPMGVITFAVMMLVLIVISGKLKKLLVGHLLARTPLQPAARTAIGTITRYLILFVGFVIILQVVGIDLTAFNVIAGAVGIGIGLGLQNIANNFISGLIILFERPIKVGDIVELEKANGEVVAIGPRATRIRTYDNITIIVPNSTFISENVINWTYAGTSMRFRIPLIVTLDSDVILVDRLMCESARENENVDKDPEPATILSKVDANGMHFELRAWTTSRNGVPSQLTSDILTVIVGKFRDNGISFADSGVMDVKMQEALTAASR
jgi:small-conductance mechanosensitive channel